MPTGTKRRRWPWVVLGAAVVGLAVVPAAATFYMHAQSYARPPAFRDAADITYADVDATLHPRREVRFPSGDATLAGYLYPAQGAEEPVGLAVVVHGLNSNADKMLPLITYFQDRGWTVFAFDGTGAGASEGDSVRGLNQQRLDLEAAISYLAGQPDLAGLPCVLVGHSMGGHAVTSAFADGIDQQLDIRAAVAFSAFDSGIETTDVLFDEYAAPVAPLLKPWVWVAYHATFGPAADVTAIDGINATSTPLMCVYGTKDEAVPAWKSGIPAHASQITNPNVQLVEVAEEYRNTHSTLWLTADSARYALETWDRRDELLGSIDGDPMEDPGYQAFVAGVDKARMTQTDPTLMRQVETFCRERVV